MAAKMTIEEQIALILKKAETATPEEAEMLTARAEKLMLRHGIDRAVAEAAGQAEKDELVWTTIVLTGVYSKVQSLMCHSVVMGYGDARGYLLSSGGSNVSYRFASYKKDGAAIKTLLESLLLQCVVAFDAAAKKEPMWRYMTASEKYNFKRSFIHAFGSAVGQRLRAAREVVVEEAKQDAAGAGTDLVLVRKSTEVERFFEDATAGTLKKCRGMSLRGDGYRAGQAAGRSANIGGRSSVAGGARGSIGR